LLGNFNSTVNVQNVVAEYNLNFPVLPNCLNSVNDLRCYSAINGITTESFVTVVGQNGNIVTLSCDGGSHSVPRSEIYVGWKPNAVRITPKLVIYNVKRSYLQTPDFTYTYVNQSFNATFKTSENYLLELHPFLYCYSNGINGMLTDDYKVISLGKENEFMCSFPDSKSILNLFGTVYTFALRIKMNSKNEDLTISSAIVITIGFLISI
jgi:hypothetical protein